MPDTDNTHSEAELRKADKAAINKISDVSSMDEALALLDERVAAHQDRLIHEVIEQSNRYDADPHYLREPFYVVPVAVLNTYLRGGNHDG